MPKKLIALLLLVVLVTMPFVTYAGTFDPNHAIAYLESKFQCGCTRGGTGAMIGRRGLITAGHNLYCHNHGVGLKYCNFYFGARGANSCWYQYSGKFTYRVYDTFSNGYNAQNDIGYVVFDGPVGDQTGWFGWMTGYDDDVNMEFMNLLNYDARRHLQNVYDVGYIRSDKLLHWRGYISGTEGGPVYISSEDRQSYVVAVYITTDSSGNGIGRRLTSDVINDMKAAGAFN